MTGLCRANNGPSVQNPFYLLPCTPDLAPLKPKAQRAYFAKKYSVLKTNSQFLEATASCQEKTSEQGLVTRKCTWEPKDFHAWSCAGLLTGIRPTSRSRGSGRPLSSFSIPISQQSFWYRAHMSRQPPARWEGFLPAHC
jgi:hypothetical protein